MYSASSGEVPIVEDPEVQQRLARGQLAGDEADDGRGGDQHEDDDERGLEPVLALTLVQHELEPVMAHLRAAGSAIDGWTGSGSVAGLGSAMASTRWAAAGTPRRGRPGRRARRAPGSPGAVPRCEA